MNAKIKKLHKAECAPLKLYQRYNNKPQQRRHLSPLTASQQPNKPHLTLNKAKHHNTQPTTHPTEQQRKPTDQIIASPSLYVYSFVLQPL
jgi:hypothetical protein